MGNTLGCFLGTLDDTVEHTLISAKYQSLGGRRSGDEKTLLKRQYSLNTTWCSDEKNGSSVKTTILQYDSSDEDQESSGSRLLNTFYNLVLECDHNQFFMDAYGKQVKGSYLQEIEIIPNYFDTERKQKTRRSSIESTKHSIWYQPSVNTWSTMSNDTSATMSCDSDYWSLMDTFIQADEGSSLSTVDPEQILYPCEYSKDPMSLFSPVKSTSCNSFQKPMEKMIKRPSYVWNEESRAKTNAARRSSLSRAAVSHTIVPVAS